MAPVESGAAAADNSQSTKRLSEFEHAVHEPGPIVGLFPENEDVFVPIEAALDATGLDLSAHLFTARRWCKKGGAKVIATVPALTEDMGLAIHLYTAESPLYTTLNRLLRDTDRSALKLRFFPYLRLLIAGLHHLGATQGDKMRMVNRGVKLDLVGLYPDEYAEDETLVWWQFSSTTSKISVLSNPMFLGKTGPRTIFQIHTSKAVDVSAFSAVQSEAELLLPPGIALKVTGVLPKSADGLTILTCEDDPNAPTLIK